MQPEKPAFVAALADLVRTEMQAATDDKKRSIAALGALKHVLAQAIVAYTQGDEVASAEIAGILAADLVKDTAAGARVASAGRPGSPQRH